MMRWKSGTGMGVVSPEERPTSDAQEMLIIDLDVIAGTTMPRGRWLTSGRGVSGKMSRRGKDAATMDAMRRT